jgi:hypothetical protein
VGLQTVIRRVRTKDGLMQAVNAWMAGRIGAARGEPVSDPPRWPPRRRASTRRSAR